MIFAQSGYRPRGSKDDYQVYVCVCVYVCVIVVTIRRLADVGLWVAVCVLAKNSFRRPTTTFARLIQSQEILQSNAFSSVSDQSEIRTSCTFFHFSKPLFLYCILYHGDQKVSWWRTCRWRAVNFEIRLCSSGMNSDLGECFFCNWGLCKPLASDRIN